MIKYYEDTMEKSAKNLLEDIETPIERKELPKVPEHLHVGKEKENKNKDESTILKLREELLQEDKKLVKGDKREMNKISRRLTPNNISRVEAFIKTSFAKGYTKEKAFNKLEHAGWRKEEIDHIYESYLLKKL